MSTFLSYTTVSERTLLTIAEIKRLLAQGLFVEPIENSPGEFVWRESDIDDWIASRPLAEDLPEPRAQRRRVH